MVDTSYYRTVAETQILPEILKAEMLDFADEVDAMLSDVLELVEAALRLRDRYCAEIGIDKDFGEHCKCHACSVTAAIAAVEEKIK